MFLGGGNCKVVRVNSASEPEWENIAHEVRNQVKMWPSQRMCESQAFGEFRILKLTVSRNDNLILLISNDIKNCFVLISDI